MTEIPPGLASLSGVEARARLAQYGPNALVAHDRLAWLREALEVLGDPMALMLAATGGVYLLLGETRDGVVMLAALVPVLGVDVFLEARSRAALKKLAETVSPRARVVRDGAVATVATTEIVPGDLLLLEEGDVVHADGVVRWSANLALDESSLTGESEPQAKRAASDAADAARPSDERAAREEPDVSFFAGSRVIAGHGWGEVKATGAKTRFGDAARLVAEAETAATPLQRRVGRLVKRLTVVALGVAVLVLALGLARHQSLANAFIGAVSLAMASVPEEFPLVFTLFLSVGAWRLGKRGMLVRRLASVETLGSTTVICTDKTGTLTRGQFQLDRFVPLATRHPEASPLGHPEAEGRGTSDDGLLEAAILACEPHPTDPMDRAIVAYAEAAGARAADVHGKWHLAFDYDFDPIGKHMSHVWRRGQETRIVAKGSIEGVLAHCTIDAEARRAIESENARLASEGMRVLALAERPLASSRGVREEDERDLVPVALLGFRDPLRPEVPAAVTECQTAGVSVKMITGDHALTAHAIAHAAGIVHDGDGIVTGDELDALDPPARAEKIARAAIFARISPKQKYAIVDALETRGEVVAMTGDGINDAPALRRADIGVSMGKRGTDVARAAADLVLVDDDFASIVATIREGRHLYSNIQSAFLYIMAFHVPIVGLAFLAPLVGIPLVLMPIHLVWLELIVHPVSALIFQADPPRPDLMRRPPRDPRAPLLPRGAVLASIGAGGVLTAAAMAQYARLLPDGEEHARAMALATLNAGYMLLIWLERAALDPKRVAPLPTSAWSYVVWVLSAASLPIVAHTPALAAAFHVTALTAREWATATAIGVGAVVWRVIADRRVRAPRGG